MKNKFTLMILLLTASCAVASYSQINIEHSDRLISKYLGGLKDISDYNLYSYDGIASPHKEFITFKNKVVSPEYETFVYFLDEMPLANWSHNCRLLFVNIETGNITSMQDKFPPNGLENWRIIKEKIFPHTGVVPYPSFNAGKTKGAVLQTGGQPSKCYAIIISGGMNSYSNHVRYWNDCSYIYSTLINKYGYLHDNIYVLMSDGTNPANDRHLLNGTYDSSPLDLDGDGTTDIQYSATPANIVSVFNTVSSKLTSDDYLFVYTTDHGSATNGESYLCLWNSDISATAFANELNKVNAGNVSVVMEQCYSGGFISRLAKQDRVIATACSATELSWAMPPTYAYNEFVYYWTAAVAGHFPNGIAVNADTNNDNYISMEEAFNYATSNDNSSETPQYSSNSTNLGTNLYLLGSISLPCSILTGLQPKPPATHKSVTCQEINIDATVPTDTKLELNAKKEVNINAGFTVEAGAELEINIIP